jgi:hypothetical protein
MAGDAERAAQLAGKAEDVRRASGFLSEVLERGVIERTETAARACLGDEAWEAARAAGERMTFDEAVAYARDGTDLAELTP